MSALANGRPEAPEGPSKPEGGVYEQLMALVPRVADELAALEVERAAILRRHAQELAKLDQKRKTLQGLGKTLGQEPPTQRRQRRAVTADEQYRWGKPSNEVVLKILNGIEQQGEERFTALGIHEQIAATWGMSHTYNAFNVLRRREYIRKAGREAKVHGRDLYAVLDREAGERLKAEMTAEPVDAS